MENKSLNIYQKLSKIRVELQNTKIKKSGMNSFQKYKYYELDDILPQINSLNDKYGLTTMFSMNTEIAELNIFDVDKPESMIKFLCPVKDPQIKGSTEIQGLGAQITYLRRYLLITAYEISESDMVDSQKPADKKGLTQPQKDLIKSAKSLEEMGIICKKIISSGVDRTEVLRFYNQIKENL